MILAIVALLFGAWMLFKHSDRIYEGIRRQMPQRQPAVIDPDDMSGVANPRQHDASKFG